MHQTKFRGAPHDFHIPLWTHQQQHMKYNNTMISRQKCNDFYLFSYIL